MEFHCIILQESYLLYVSVCALECVREPRVCVAGCSLHRYKQRYFPPSMGISQNLVTPLQEAESVFPPLQRNLCQSDGPDE